MIQVMCWTLAATAVPETFGEHASLWSIRLALLALVAALAMQLRGVRSTDKRLVSIWFIGSLLAFGHSLGSLLTFHHGSQVAAWESTAQQTQELLGFAFGAGLYVNYIFVVVWASDAIFRLVAPARYERLPNTYSYLMNGFLVFIAFNGAVVFKAGIIRWIGLLCSALLVALWWRQQRAKNIAA